MKLFINTCRQEGIDIIVSMSSTIFGWPGAVWDPTRFSASAKRAWNKYHFHKSSTFLNISDNNFFCQYKIIICFGMEVCSGYRTSATCIILLIWSVWKKNCKRNWFNLNFYMYNMFNLKFDFYMSELILLLEYLFNLNFELWTLNLNLNLNFEL